MRAGEDIAEVIDIATRAQDIDSWAVHGATFPHLSIALFERFHALSHVENAGDFVVIER
jgi:hypothetical protein